MNKKVVSAEKLVQKAILSDHLLFGATSIWQ